MKNLFFAVFAVLMSITVLQAEERPVELLDAVLPPELVDAMVEAVLLHRKGVAGDEEAVKAAIELLENLDGDPTPIGVGILGSLYTLKGRDASNVVNAMRFTNRGIQMIDEAVEMQPDGYSVRMLRAINNIEIPVMFGRREIAIGDMKFIIDQYTATDHSRSNSTVKVVLGHLIEYAENNNHDDDKKRWEALLETIN